MGDSPATSNSGGRKRNVLKCYHRRDAKKRTASRGVNGGRSFFGCASWPEDDCGFFLWEDDLLTPTMEALAKNKDAVIEDMLKKNELLEQKVLRLKGKQHSFLKELKDLQVTLQQQIGRERTIVVALVMSWIVFASALYFS